MKKLLTLCLCLALGCSMLAGCSSEKDKNESKEASTKSSSALTFETVTAANYSMKVVKDAEINEIPDAGAYISGKIGKVVYTTTITRAPFSEEDSTDAEDISDTYGVMLQSIADNLQEFEITTLGIKSTAFKGVIKLDKKDLQELVDGLGHVPSTENNFDGTLYLYSAAIPEKENSSVLMVQTFCTSESIGLELFETLVGSMKAI